MTELGFSDLRDRALHDLASDRCVSVVGLSNSGKSTLMRSLATKQAVQRYREIAGKQALLVYIDCNRAVALSAQAFYEVVLRALLEKMDALNATPRKSAGSSKERLVGITRALHGYYEAVTEAATGFNASLAFNLALTELCEQLGDDLCLLLDEFDELYAALDDRALLNLRALRDRFRERLRYATATIRRLPEIRGGEVEGEFAELFAHSAYFIPLLSLVESEELLRGLGLSDLPASAAEVCHQLSGGHPGLTVAVARALSQLPDMPPQALDSAISHEPRARAECLKIWTQLSSQEQESMKTLVIEMGEGLPARRMQRLQELGLVRARLPFSPLFAEFVGRLHHGALAPTEGIRLDLDSGDVWVDGVRVPVLTDLEFRLLKLLYERRDKITDKFHIVQGVWGDEYLEEVDDARVEKLVSRLRSKVERDPSEPTYLITQRGRGYKLLSRPRRAGSG